MSNQLTRGVTVLAAVAMLFFFAPSASGDAPVASPVEATAAWVQARMLVAAPPARGRTYPGAVETKEEGEQRYAEIARAVVEVAYDPTEAALFGGKQGRARTAMLLASVAFFESGYRRDVDLGVGRWARGDSGASHCLMQVNIGKNKTAEGWNGPELVASRDKCFRAGLHVLAASMRACRSLPAVDRLAAYVSGRCVPGLPGARSRMEFAMRSFAQRPPPGLDDQVIRALGARALSEPPAEQPVAVTE